MVAPPPVRQEAAPAAPPLPEARPAATPAPAPAITWRCLLIGTAIIPFNIYWIGMTEGVWHGLHFTCLSLPMTAIFYLLCLMALNEALRRWRPERAFSQAELLTIFGMLAI